MRIVLTVLLLAGTLSTAFSQNSRIWVVPSTGKQPALPDTVIQRFKDEMRKNQLPYNGIPNAITVKPLPPVYKGNNGLGFDIYESQVDNMPVLMPDKNNAASLGLTDAKTSEKNMPNGVRSYNLYGQEYDDLLKKLKEKDSLPPKPWRPKVFRSPKK